jgi:hypothetical protein
MTTYDDTILYDADIPYDGVDFVFVPLGVSASVDVFHLTVPEEQTQNTTWFSIVNLVDNSGNQLVDNSGNRLVAIVPVIETVYVIHTPQDQYSLLAEEDMFDIFLNPDDLSLTIPEEQTEHTTWYGTYYLTDNSGNKLTDNSGNYLTATIPTVESVYVLHVAPDDLSIIVNEET